MFDLETATKKYSAKSTSRLLGMNEARGGHFLRSIKSVFNALPIVALLLLALSVASANAQLSTAQVTGTVADSTGAIIPGALVSATQTATGVVTKTTANDQGIFVLPSLAVGSYTLDVEGPGFKPYRQTDLVLTVGQQLTVKVGLQVGASDQVVTVTSSSVAVDSSTPTEQTTVEEKTIRDLPLNGRNPATLMFTVAGVSDSTLNIPPTSLQNAVKTQDVNSPQESAPSVHGSRPGGTYFSLDGASNTDPFTVIGAPFPNPDATGEFSVVTGTFGARYVSAPGGAINIVTKSGTNQIHGTVFEFIRNGYFNARNAISTQKDVLKRNQFGFALGGPILRDRLFFFGTYQATPVSDASTSTGFFPTAKQRTGDFGTFKIPASMISPAVQKLLPFIPLGDPTTGFLSYQVPQRSNDQQGLIKFDLALGHHRDFVRVFYDRFVSQASGASGAGMLLAAHSGFVQPWQSAAVGDTWTLGKFVLDTRVSYSRALSTQTQSGATGTSLSTLGLTNVSGIAPNPAYSVLQVVGGFNLIPGLQPSKFPRKELEFTEDVFFIKGKHQVSFGANYRRIALDEYNQAGQNPIALFYGVNSYIDGLYGIIPGATLNPTADFIMGAPYVFAQGDGVFANVRGNLFGTYVEDNYKASKRLSLTAGVRWDPSFPYTPQNGRVSCYVPGSQSTVYTNAFTGLIFPGDPGCPSAGANHSLVQIEPRVGLAYQLDNTGKSVVRAGYGRYDLQAPLNAFVGFSNQPFTRRYLVFQPGLKLDNIWGSMGSTDPFSSGFRTPTYAPPANVPFVKALAASSFDPNIHPAYIQQWSLSLQRLLTSKDSIDMAYNGTAGVHLPLTFDANVPVYTGAASTAANEQARRPNPNYGEVYYMRGNGTSSYNGVDITYKHQSATFSLNSAFSWSKALDDNSQAAVTDVATIVSSNRNFRRARSDYDQPFLWRTTGTYNTPKLSNYNTFVRTAAGSWTVAGLLELDSGQPFSVTDSADFSLTGDGLDYADRVPGVPVYLNGKLNAAAFTNNATGTFGNSGRNAYRGTSYKNLDMALIKDFPIRERYHATFRAETFNLLNHPNFLPPDHVYGDAAFGTNLIARAPRIMQFSLKASF